MSKLRVFKEGVLDFAQEVGTDIKNLRQKINGLIDDNSDNTTNTWSSSKIRNFVIQSTQGIGNFTIEVVPQLPVAGSDYTIYLVEKDAGQTNNIYEEWIFVAGEWELIGDTETDLNGYVQESQIPGLLGLEVSASQGKILTTNDFTTALKNKLEALTKSSRAQAENGTNDDTYITPLKLVNFVDYEIGDADPLQTYEDYSN